MQQHVPQLGQASTTQPKCMSSLEYPFTQGTTNLAKVGRLREIREKLHAPRSISSYAHDDESRDHHSVSEESSSCLSNNNECLSNNARFKQQQFHNVTRPASTLQDVSLHYTPSASLRRGDSSTVLSQEQTRHSQATSFRSVPLQSSHANTNYTVYSSHNGYNNIKKMVEHYYDKNNETNMHKIQPGNPAESSASLQRRSSFSKKSLSNRNMGNDNTTSERVSTKSKPYKGSAGNSVSTRHSSSYVSNGATRKEQHFARGVISKGRYAGQKVIDEPLLNIYGHNGVKDNVSQSFHQSISRSKKPCCDIYTESSIHDYISADVVATELNNRKICHQHNITTESMRDTRNENTSLMPSKKISLMRNIIKSKQPHFNIDYCVQSDTATNAHCRQSHLQSQKIQSLDKQNKENINQLEISDDAFLSSGCSSFSSRPSVNRNISEEEKRKGQRQDGNGLLDKRYKPNHLTLGTQQVRLGVVCKEQSGGGSSNCNIEFNEEELTQQHNIEPPSATQNHNPNLSSEISSKDLLVPYISRAKKSNSRSCRRWHSASGRHCNDIIESKHHESNAQLTSMPPHTEQSMTKLVAHDLEGFNSEDAAELSSCDRKNLVNETFVQELKRFYIDFEKKDLLCHPQQHSLSGKKGSLPLIYPRRETSTFSNSTDDQKPDICLVKKALKTVALDNAILKERLQQSRERIKHLNAEINDHLATRSRQSLRICEITDALRLLDARIESDRTAPRWIVGPLHSAIGCLEHLLGLSHRASGRNICNTNNNSERHMSVTAKDEEQDHGENRCPSMLTDTIPADTLEYQCYLAQQSSEAEKQLDVASKDAICSSAIANITTLSDRAFRQKSCIANGLLLNPKSARSTTTPHSQEIVDKEQMLTMSLDKKISPLHARPQIPLLSLKENNIGCGTWLSGEATQGDTYSRVV